MASVSISANGATTSPYLYSTATVSEKSRNGTSVVLSISISSNLQYSSSWIGSGYTYTGTVTAYGQTKAFTLKSSSETWSGNGKHTTTGTINLTVPADKTSIAVNYKCAVSGLETNTVTGTEQNLALSKVLATTNSVTNFTDTTNPTINFSNPGNFNLYPYINLWTQQTGGKQLGSTIRPSGMSTSGAKINSPYTWNLTEAQRNQIRDWLETRTTAYATIGVDTMSGTTKLGASSKGATLTNVLAPPIFTDFEYEDINQDTIDITNDSSKIVLGYSTLKITINGSNVPQAQKGANMRHYLINNIQYPYSDNFSVNIEKWASNSISITAVDSRGVSTVLTKQLNVADYTPLEKRNSKIIRDGNVAEETKLSFDGYIKQTLPNGSANTLTVSYKYKNTEDSTYTTGTTVIVPTINNDSFSYENYIVGDIAEGFEINNSYNVIVTVSDILSSVEYDFILNGGIPAIAIKGNNVAIHGKYDEILGGTQLNSPVYLDKKLLTMQRDIMTIRLTSNYEIRANNTAEKITGLTLYNSLGNKLTFSNNNIVIGNGVKKILASYQMILTSVNNSTRAFTYLRKNDVAISQESAYFSGTGQQFTNVLNPVLIDVQEGDYFNLQVYGGAGNTVLGTTSFTHGLTIEVVEYE